MRFGLGGDWAMTRRKAEAPEAEREKDVFLVEVGKRVRERRISLKLTQNQAADACGVPQTLIFSTEAGLQNLTLKTLAKLAKGLETTERDLMPVTPEVLEQESWSASRRGSPAQAGAAHCAAAAGRRRELHYIVGRTHSRRLQVANRRDFRALTIFT